MFFLYNTEKNISSKITMITNMWDSFETAKKEQIYRLLSVDDLTRYLQEYYRNPSAKNKERVNLCLANFQTSDSESKYLFMEDEEGNLFHSLNSYASEIPDILKNSEEYKRTRESGNSFISPIKKGGEEGLPDFYSCYIDSQEVYGHVLTVCFCYDVRNLVRSIGNAKNGLDLVQLYNAYGEELYSSRQEEGEQEEAKTVFED